MSRQRVSVPQFGAVAVVRISRASRQLPTLPPPNRANPTASTNSGLDKTWRARSLSSNFEVGARDHHSGRRPHAPDAKGEVLCFVRKLSNYN